MIKFYVNRELSDLLDIRLSKWKRWSREFLPPDPLGGMQSGYARQYTPDQAFTVYMGGHLVSALNFSIAEVKQILEDLTPWLRKQNILGQTNGSLHQGKRNRGGVDSRVYIFRRLSKDNTGVAFAYIERTRLYEEAYEQHGAHVRREVYRERSISAAVSGETVAAADNLEKIDSRIFYVTHLYDRFAKKLVG
ncbi:MAG: hypothetical protein JRD49_03240 [Deltaproteobacteria bacterium]|nr:hypothetical protein [Deltaproteobacteria bacterium]MBW2635514.1 hypothetical protein [Deltaproteobacteria bacterium]MBW2676561.1 hypothetical protein [Deltaproteobacteria bacterium]